MNPGSLSSGSIGWTIARPSYVIRATHHGPVLEQSWMVRYRFESPAGLAQHLGLGDGLLLPGLPLACARGARVLVQATFPESRDAALLHGRIDKRTGEGVWVSVAARGHWSPLGGQRRSPRVAADLFAEVSAPGEEPFLCRAPDVSAEGLRLSGVSLDGVLRGEELQLSLLWDGPPLKLRGKLVWSARGEAGLSLVDPPRELAQLLRGLSGRWERAAELLHGAQCPCASGQRQP